MVLRLISALLVATLGIVAVLPQTVESQFTYPEPACYANLRLNNLHRRVFGSVNTECPGSIPVQLPFPISHSSMGKLGSHV